MLRYAISDRLGLGEDEGTRQAALLGHVRRWASEGMDFVQLREKDLPAAALATLVRRLLQTLRRHSPDASARPKLLIHSRADIALAVGADGVHLTSDIGSLRPAQVAHLYAAAGVPDPFVSVSCHTVGEVARASQSGASLILFGPIFEKRVHGRQVAAGVGLAALHEACVAAEGRPVLALGGVTVENASRCMAAGAAGIAGIRIFLD